MKKKTIHIDHISIGRLPGFRKGLPEYRDLSENINIIYGPNASGKSSTAGMIEKLLWQKKAPGCRAEAKIQLDHEQWRISIDSSRVNSERNGQPAQMEGIPASDTSKRYMLSLHELIQADDQDMARQIMREGIGGYDLDKASGDLKYDASIRNKRVSEYTAWEEAKKNYQKVRQEQKHLESEEANLDELKKDKDRAEKAAKLAELYQLWQKYLEKKTEHLRAKEKLNHFPQILENLTGHEYETLKELESEAEKLENEILDTKKSIENAVEHLAQLDIPETGIGDEILNELEGRSEELKELRHRREKASEESLAAAKKAEESLHALARDIDSDKWAGLNLKQTNDLHQIMPEAYRLTGESLQLQNRIHKISELLADRKKPDFARTELAISILSDWLKARGEQTGISKKRLWTIAIAGIATTILTYALSLISVLAALAPLIIGTALILILSFKQPKTESTTGNKYKQEYERNGIEGPETWTSESVSARLTELSENLQLATETHHLKNEKQRLEDNLDKLKPRLEKIQSQFQEIQTELGAVPELHLKDENNYASIAWFVSNAQKWQEAQENHLAARELTNQLEKKTEENLVRVNAILESHGQDTVDDDIKLSALCKKIRDNEYQRRESVKHIKEKNLVLKEKLERKEKNLDKQNKLYQRLNIETGRLDEVKQLGEELSQYRPAKKAFEAAELMGREAEKNLKAHSLYQEEAENLESLSPDEVSDKITGYQEKAGRLTEIIETISGINTRIASVSKANTAEKALAEEEKAMSDLESLYEKNLASITGHLLVTHLKAETREHNYPEVFKKASHRFSKITAGQYRLDLSNGESHAFMAYDNQNDEYLSLDKLSTGTRIQLILSVRLAFIELQENELCLPVMADELLANSDEVRAKAIIDALIEISREGRQVFYFTAQQDEVAKWQTHLEVSGISSRIISIPGSQGNQEYPHVSASLPLIHLTNHELSPPGQASHAEYGKILGVQEFNPLSDAISGLHLWYVIEDTELLYSCLKRNMSSLGALLGFLKAGGKIGKGPDFTRQLEEKKKLLERYLTLYRHGRSLPIDRQVLESSDAVSEGFLDDVADVLDEVKGNPEKLIKILLDGGVRNFRTAKAEELENYLKQKNFISQETPLEEEKIIAGLQAELSGMNLDSQSAERMLHRISDSASA